MKSWSNWKPQRFEEDTRHGGCLDQATARRLVSKTYFAQDPRRLALMNLYLHGLDQAELFAAGEGGD